jgi:hypothetical protein
MPASQRTPTPPSIKLLNQFHYTGVHCTGRQSALPLIQESSHSHRRIRQTHPAAVSPCLNTLPSYSPKFTKETRKLSWWVTDVHGYASCAAAHLPDHHTPSEPSGMSRPTGPCFANHLHENSHALIVRNTKTDMKTCHVLSRPFGNFPEGLELLR